MIFNSLANNASDAYNFGLNVTLSKITVQYCTYENGNTFFILESEYMSIAKSIFKNIGTFSLFQDSILSNW